MIRDDRKNEIRYIDDDIEEVRSPIDIARRERSSRESLRYIDILEEALKEVDYEKIDGSIIEGND